MAQVPAPSDERGDEQLVAVRRAVLNDVEHAVGNLLQRMHHAARTAKAGLGALFFDYVSPVEVQVRPTDAERIAESLAAQLRAQGVSEVRLGATAATRVLADPRVMGRSFLLLAQACARELDGAGPVAIWLQALCRISSTRRTSSSGRAFCSGGDQRIRRQRGHRRSEHEGRHIRLGQDGEALAD